MSRSILFPGPKVVKVAETDTLKVYESQNPEKRQRKISSKPAVPKQDAAVANPKKQLFSA